jgi:hypothetical protein
MKETVHFLAIHAYSLLFISVLARQACLPVPANLVLLAAGALAGSGKLNFGVIFFFWFSPFYQRTSPGSPEVGQQNPLFRMWVLRRSEHVCAKREPIVRSTRGEIAPDSKFVLGLDAVAASLGRGIRYTPSTVSSFRCSGNPALVRCLHNIGLHFQRTIGTVLGPFRSTFGLDENRHHGRCRIRLTLGQLPM